MAYLTESVGFAGDSLRAVEKHALYIWKREVTFSS